MYIAPDPSKLRPSATRLLSPGAPDVAQTSDKHGKKVKSGVGEAAATSDVATASKVGGAGRSPQALFAALEKSAEGKVRPEPPADKRFGPKTLDALIEAQAALEQAAQRVVDALDADGDGAFSLDELKSGLPGKSGEAPGRAARAEKLFERLDADGDGKVALAELTALFAPKPVEDEPAPVETADNALTSEVIDPAKEQPAPGA